MHTNASGNYLLQERYEIQQQLGKRAGRQTLLAQDLETQKPVVIKLLTFNEEFEWEDLKLFKREAEILQALSHPAIPRYLDHFELETANGRGFALVQSYIEAPSLEQHLKAGRRFSEAEVKELARAVLNILIDLHGQAPPIIHRDIKPSNILLTNRSAHSAGQLYLVDFGSVQTFAEREGGTITVVGTYGYMPPEQFGGRAVPASDLYSLGATLIYLVTGIHPADLPQTDSMRIAFEPSVNLSPALAGWLQWITEPALDQRLTSAQAALAALEQEQLQKPLPLAVSKPAHSNITFVEYQDSLEICFPCAGFNSATLFKMVSPGHGIILSMYIPSIIAFSVLLGSFWRGFIVGGGSSFLLAIIIPNLLFQVFGHIRLRLDSQQVSLSKELFGLKQQMAHRSRRREIRNLEYRRWSSMQTGKDKPIEVKPTITIWSGTQKYELNGNFFESAGIELNEAEMDWLAYELSRWLESRSPEDQ